LLRPIWPGARREEGASPASGAVTDEQRSPRPNSAQPFGRRFLSAQAALLAPYRSTGGICSSLAPCLGRKLLAANVTVFTPWTNKRAPNPPLPFGPTATRSWDVRKAGARSRQERGIHSAWLTRFQKGGMNSALRFGPLLDAYWDRL